MQAAGINLSAFGLARRPLLAVAADKGKGELHIELQPATAFLGKFKLSDECNAVFDQWRAGLLGLPRPVAVDVALTADLPVEARFLWELTHRPLDFAFYGDAPRTDRVGDFGERFRAMLSRSAFTLGKDLLETAPAATVELLQFRGQYRDGACHHGKNGWKADDSEQRADKLLAKLVAELGVNPGQGAERLNGDDVAAMLCALAALGSAKGEGVLLPADLNAQVSERCGRRGGFEPNPRHKAPPHSAVLAQPFWESITVTRSAAE
ncbi:MAG: hypothetical protein IT463_10295 [Planctomycetes bacterium]|nr:hypothetical protein [Planctomycetota bacterium]